MRKLHLNHNIYGAFFVLVIMGLTAVTYFTTSINQETHTVQSQAAGTCGSNCDNKNVWISDCLRYNGSDKTAQCNDWFTAECGGCSGTSGGTTGGGNNNSGSGSVTPFDPTATANDSSVQNLCGANPSDPRCCKINEWKNTNLGTNFPVCSGSTGGTGNPTAAPTLVAGSAGSCNNGQIPNGYWACFSTTKVIQCINGTYQNETSCTSCRGISADKSSICSGSTSAPGQCASPEIWCASLSKCTGRTACPTPPPNTTDGRCTYIGDVDCITLTPAPGQCASPEIWCSTLNKCTGRTACPTPPPNTTDGRCTYIGDVDCITLTPAPGQCASPEVWCATLNKCAGRTSCPTPTPTPASQVFLPLIQNGKPTSVPTPTVVQTANPNACGQPGAACCSTAFQQSACVTNGYECIAGKCRIGYAGFDDSSVAQVQTQLAQCTVNSSSPQCKPEVITVQQELTFSKCVPLQNGVGFMCAE